MLQKYKSDSSDQRPDSWSELSVGWKWVWVGSFLIAFLVGIGMGIYLTFA